MSTISAPNRVFKAVDFESGPKVLTISAIKKENVAPKDKPAVVKVVVHFQETERRSSLTRSRAHVLETLYGTGSKNAIGKRIELFRALASLNGKDVPCVAFRAPCGGSRAK